MSRIGYPIALAIIVWVVWNYLGLKKHGALGYLKHVAIIPGIPKASLLLVAPLEFFSTIFVRPLSHALRLFANMFAGHLLLLVFTLGAEYMFFESGSPIQMVLAPFAAGMAIVMTLFEALIQLIQAYIFTLLAALYIAGALAEDH
jgi:F-type H+-transporting ATPase subunit a